MASSDGYLRSDVDKGEISPDTDGRLRSDSDKVGAPPAGWSHKFLGVANASIAKINGVAIANIAKVNGVA